MPLVLLLLHAGAALVAGIAAIALFFAGSALGLVQDAHFTAGMAVVGALAGAVGGVLAAIGTWLSLRSRDASAGGTAALCWFAWALAGAAGGAMADKGLVALPAVALFTFITTLVVRARAPEKAVTTA